MYKFKYGRSFKIIYWGYQFDSILELKFAISIRKDYQFLRSQIPIYYDPVTRKPTDNIRGNIVRYTPDFLIRHKVTGQAFLVEVKPKAYDDEKDLSKRKEVAENYISWKGYDWNYVLIYSDEVILSPDEEMELEECLKLKSSSSSKIRLQKANDRYDRSMPSLFKPFINNKQIRFVMFGADT